MRLSTFRTAMWMTGDRPEEGEGKVLDERGSNRLVVNHHRLRARLVRLVRHLRLVAHTANVNTCPEDTAKAKDASVASITNV